MTQTPLGPTMGCIAPDCAADTWPDEDWLIIDTPVGPFEVLMCDAHYAQYTAGTFNPTGNSWARAVEMVNTHPVVHRG
jgi:hypothetical protein